MVYEYRWVGVGVDVGRVAFCFRCVRSYAHTSSHVGNDVRV